MLSNFALFLKQNTEGVQHSLLPNTPSEMSGLKIPRCPLATRDPSNHRAPRPHGVTYLTQDSSILSTPGQAEVN